MFYIYEWYNVNSGEIFYVGKGCGNRYRSMNHRNKLFKEYIKNNTCASRIIREFDSEESAFNYERERILELKSQGQATCNLDNGGAGGPQFIWTDEMRKYKSLYNPMKDPKQRERMSRENPVKNREIGEKAWSTRRKAVIIGGREFKSVTEASKYFNVRESTVIKWCRKGINPNHEPCRYKNGEQVVFTGKRYNIGGCRPLSYKGKIYESPIDLSDELGLHHSTITKWAQKGFDPKGNPCRYLDDEEKHEFTQYEPGACSRKPIYVNGVLYNSKADAERKLGLCVGYLAPYLAGKRKNNNYICEYANQKPSRGNSDNSTPEGSTTNE